MRLLPFVLAAALLSVFPAAAFAQGANVGLYSDATGTTCSFSGNNPGTITAYVVFRPDAGGVNTLQFSAPVPACLGAVYVSETVTPGMTKLGNSQTGASILLQSCFSQPVSVLQINYLRSASTEPCCPYPILPDPALSEIAASNCAFQEVDVTSVVAHFNADASCACQGNSPPTSPELPVPTNGAPSVSVTPTFSWWSSDFDNNITGYDIYLGTTSPPPLVASNVPVMSYTPPTPLPQLTLHYWRVVVRDAGGAQTSGPTWTFTTRETNPPPSPPSNPVPANGALEVTINVTLDWQGLDPDGEPVTFDVYFGTASPPPLVASDIAVSQYTLPQLTYGTTYRWRVVARDPIGQERSGPEWSFTTRPSNYPPLQPSQPVPSSGSTNRPLNQVLQWTAVDPESDPLVFDVYIGTASPPPLVATNLPNPSYAPAGLEYSTTYFWRVAVRDTADNVTTGPVWSFTTRPFNLPPNAPANPSPAHLATNQPINTTLSWTCSDPDNQPLTFDVYFGTATNPPLVASNVDTTSYSPGPLSSSTTYRWRIVARDPGNLVTSGPTWRFTTGTIGSPPTVPSAPSPPNHATNQPTTLTLSWSSTDPDGQALVFDVYFGTSATPPLVATGISATTYAVGPLQLQVTYRWRIVARDPDANQTSGPTWDFTTRPGCAPAVVAPANGAPNQPLMLTLRWTCGNPNANPESYDLYFGTASPPPLLATGITLQQYVLGDLTGGTLYRWKIVSHNTDGSENEGPIWSFTTKINAVPIVNNSWPINGASSVLSPTLRWTGSDPDGTPLTYNVYFGSNGPLPLVASGLTQPNYTPPGPLQPQTTYFWYVEVSDGANTVVGPTWSFVPCIPGDVVADGVLNTADVDCALQIYLWNPACGGPGAYQVGDVDCNYNITPRDARCIHKESIDGSCDVCVVDGTAEDAAVAGAKAATSSNWPTITVTTVFTQLDTLVVRLAVSNIPTLEAFGFHTLASAKIKPVAMLRRGVTSSFTRFEWREVGPRSFMFGGYTLGGVPIDGTQEWIELRFDISEGREGTLFITDFVDDFTGSNQVYIPLDPSVGAGPIASELVLHQNHPNPFNPQTTIAYDVPASLDRERVRLSILDISGRLITTLVDDEQASGPHIARWFGQDRSGQRVASGVYFYVLQVGDERRTRKLVLLK